MQGGSVSLAGGVYNSDQHSYWNVSGSLQFGQMSNLTVGQYSQLIIPKNGALFSLWRKERWQWL